MKVNLVFFSVVEKLCNCTRVETFIYGKALFCSEESHLPFYPRTGGINGYQHSKPWAVSEDPCCFDNFVLLSHLKTGR